MTNNASSSFYTKSVKTQKMSELSFKSETTYQITDLDYTSYTAGAQGNSFLQGLFIRGPAAHGGWGVRRG